MHKVYIYEPKNKSILTYSARLNEKGISDLAGVPPLKENISDRLQIRFRIDENLNQSELCCWQLDDKRNIKRCYAGIVIFEGIDENGGSRDINTEDILYIQRHFEPYQYARF